MFALVHKLTREHAPSCRAPEEGCHCTAEERNKQEERQYWATSFLAIIAGIIGAMVGYNFSMAALSDSLHAFADGFADIWGVRVMRKIGKNPSQEKILRRKGTRFIALLLVVAALLVFHEAGDRFTGDGYVVSPVWILFVGFATSVIDLTRVWILSLAQSHKPNEMRGALIEHAVLDLRRSELLVVMGFLMSAVQLIVPMVSVLLAPQIGTWLRGTDLLISMALAVYMLKIAHMMWTGKHSHVHREMQFEKWLIKKVLGIRIHLHHHH